MKVLLTGGGTGGHITPLLAVAHELKAKQPNLSLVYVGERNGKFVDLLAKEGGLFDSTRFIFAGKLRRYHDQNWLQSLLDVKTNLLNLRDLARLGVGFCQSIWILLKERPKVVFIKGGFVGVPVGLAAAILRIPYVTHDSDTVPGLANRLISKWAKFNATGMPAEFYNYPTAKKRFTGIPVSPSFQLVKKEDQQKSKAQLGIDKELKVVLITGGSQGSKRINQALTRIVPDLIKHGVFVIHHVGRGNEAVYGDFTSAHLKIESFIPEFYKATAAADVVVARAGANTIAELGIQAKPVILVPSPFLAGGHQLKNAEYLKKQNAALVVEETELEQDPFVLINTLIGLLENPSQQQNLAKNLSALSRPKAAKDLAELLLEAAES